MLVTLIFISFLLCYVRGLAALSFLLSFSMKLTSLVLTDRCGLDPSGLDPSGLYPSNQGGVQEHPRERTRTGGTELASHRSPEAVQVSGDRDGVVRPPWTPRNRRHAARAGAWTRSAASCEVGARCLPPRVRTRREFLRQGGSGSRGGSAPQ